MGLDAATQRFLARPKAGNTVRAYKNDIVTILLLIVIFLLSIGYKSFSFPLSRNYILFQFYERIQII
jgi:hypothetical protein